MARWAYSKGLHDLGNGCWAYLQPDGSWGWSNAGLIESRGETLLVDTLYDLKLTREMLDTMHASVPASADIGVLVNSHSNADHTFGNQLVDGAEIIASRKCYEEMVQVDVEARRQELRNWRELGDAGRPGDDTPEYTVPPGHYFMMGDNRDNSADSRVPVAEGGVGLLPIDNLVGRVDTVLGSWDIAAKHQPIWSWPSGLRLSRTFSSVQ